MSSKELERGGLKVLLRRLEGFTDKAVLSKPFTFQCPPLEQFTVQHAFSHSDYDTISEGQLSRPGTRQLRQISFNTLFVDFGPPWGFFDTDPVNFEKQYRRRDTLNPKESALLLERILNTGTPFRLTVNSVNLWDKPDVDMYATLRAMSVTERAGEVDARYADVQFVEFRSPFLAAPVSESNRAKAGNPSKNLPASVSIKSLPAGRRTVTALAKFYYGSASRTIPIRKANPFLAGIGNNTDLVVHFKKQPMLKIKVPKV